MVVVILLAGAGVFLVVDETSPPWYERLRYPLRYQEFVRAHAHNYGIDPALLAAVIWQESKFDAGAKSGSGAIGLMQLTPRTAHGIAVRTGGSAFHTHDLYDADINIRALIFALLALACGHMLSTLLRTIPAISLDLMAADFNTPRIRPID